MHSRPPCCCSARPPPRRAHDALVAGTKYHATADISCVTVMGGKPGACKAGVIRKSGGNAVVEMQTPDGGQRSITFTGGKAPVIDGFTGDQRFFLAWGQIWRERVAEAEQRRRLLSDPHSPGEFRANGIVRNVDAWYEAFGVKPGDKLYLPPNQRVKIW